MSLYDGIKDVAKIVQQADNIDLYRKLLDLSAQALELQLENAKLREENAELKKGKSIEDRICRHYNPYLTLVDDKPELKYCSVCWDNEHKLIQMREQTESMSNSTWKSLRCHKCGNRCQLD